MMLLICGLRALKFLETDSERVGARAWEET